MPVFVWAFRCPFEELSTQQTCNSVSEERRNTQTLLSESSEGLLPCSFFFFPSRTTLIQQGHCPLPVGYSDLCYAATSSEEHNDVACGHNSHRSQT